MSLQIVILSIIGNIVALSFRRIKVCSFCKRTKKTKKYIFPYHFQGKYDTLFHTYYFVWKGLAARCKREG